MEKYPDIFGRFIDVTRILAVEGPVARDKIYGIVYDVLSFHKLLSNRGGININNRVMDVISAANEMAFKITKLQADELHFCELDEEIMLNDDREMMGVNANIIRTISDEKRTLNALLGIFNGLLRYM